MVGSSRNERLAITKTKLPPCCIETYPKDDSKLIMGTYKLQEDGSRYGSLDLYHYNENEPSEDKKLNLVTSVTVQSSILDLKFSVVDDDTFVTAHSKGNIIIWKFKSESNTFEKVKELQIFEESLLVTSIVFSPVEAGEILATCTNGETAQVNLNKENTSIFSTTHDLECWIGAYGELGAISRVAFTGGDDGKLIAHDLRSKDKIWSTNARHHDAGVVSILLPSPTWNSTNNNHIWTGSYDDKVRIFDLRMILSENSEQFLPMLPKVIYEENLGGGVWRLVPNKMPNDDRVLACCMYDGARILKPVGETLDVVQYFKGDHESMCYGGDWNHTGDSVTTISFYDHVVQTWKPSNS